MSLVCVVQMAMEKHKMNVPETMNEVLDMSDDEGKQFREHVCVAVETGPVGGC